MKTGNFRVFFSLVMFLALVFLAGCDEAELQSQWHTTLAANQESFNVEWPEDGNYFDEDSKVLVTVMNDADNLYIRMLTRNQESRMLILRAGFTLWLDSSGNANKSYGVQFPMARQRTMGRTMQDHKTRTDFKEVLEDSQYNLAILYDSGESRQTMPVSRAEEIGVYTGLRMDNNFLVYELKFPLGTVGANRMIMLCFESGKLEKPAGGGGGGGGGGGRGGGGGGGRGGGGGGGGGKKMGGKGGGQGKSMPKPFELWAKVHLAEKPGK